MYWYASVTACVYLRTRGFFSLYLSSYICAWFKYYVACAVPNLTACC